MIPSVNSTISALQAYKSKMRVTANNIANVNTDEFKKAFLETIATWPVSDDPSFRPPTVDLKVVPEYPVMRLHESDTVVETIRQAGIALGREQSFIVAGGGSDANIFN